jgi:hypothetical protein
MAQGGPKKEHQMNSNRIATYNWGAAYLTGSQIVVVVDNGHHMNKAELVATARKLGLAITKTIRSIHQVGTKGHIYATKAVA